MKKRKSKIENVIKEEIDPEVKKIEKLRPIEVSKRISQLLLLDREKLVKIINNKYGAPCLDVLISKIILHGVTTPKALEAVACAEWLMNRSIGKAEGLVKQGEIDQGSRKITYITTIEGDGSIQNQVIESKEIEERIYE